MVREVRQPSLITPKRPRVSSSAPTTTSRILSPRFSTQPASKAPRVATSTVKKRVVLGERADNVTIPTSQPSQPTRVVSNAGQAKPARPSLGPPSRRFLPRPIPVATATSLNTSSSSAHSHLTRHAETFRPRSSLVLQINEDDTQLLDMQPPEMPDMYLASETETSCDEMSTRQERGMLMTPANSQEVPDVSLRRLVSPARFSVPPQQETFRLPTPPSSQSQFDPEATLPPSSSTHSRSRPSSTPPRRTSTAAPILLSETQHPSPNPRRRKSPCLEQAAIQPQPIRLRSPFEIQDRTEVLPSPRARASKSRTPSASIIHSASSAIRSNLPFTSRTPFSSHATREVPSTAPAAAQGPRLSAARRFATPKTVQAKPRSRLQTPLSSGRLRRSLTPSARKLLSEVRVGYLEKEVEVSPGDDPLLLKALDGEDRFERREVALACAGLELVLGNAVQATSSRLSAAAGSPAEDRSVDQNRFHEQEAHHDVGGCASDNDTDFEDGDNQRDDTFLRVLSRQRPLSQPRSPEADLFPENSVLHQVSPLIVPLVTPEAVVGDAPSSALDNLAFDKRPHEMEAGATTRRRVDLDDIDLADDGDGGSGGLGRAHAGWDDFSVGAATGSDSASDSSPARTFDNEGAELPDEGVTMEAESGDWDSCPDDQADEINGELLQQSPPPCSTGNSSHIDSPAVDDDVSLHVENQSERSPTRLESAPRRDTSEQVIIENEGCPGIPSSPEDGQEGDVTVEADSADWYLSQPEPEAYGDEASQRSTAPPDDETSSTSEDVSSEEAPSEAPEEEGDQPVDVSEKIVIKVIDRGVIKVEADQTRGAVATRINTIDPGDTRLSASPSSSTLVYPPLPALAPLSLTATNTGPPPPAHRPVSVPIPSNTSSTPGPLVYRYSNAPAIEAMLRRRTSSSAGSSRPFSRLSHQVIPAESSTTASGPKRPLHNELASVSATEGDELGDESIRSVVEVSSLDPRSAARAAAILKLNHAYIEHGLLPLPTPSSSSARLPTDTPRRRRTRRFDSPHFATLSTATKLGKDELLHEAELEIVATRRSRSRSTCRTESGWGSGESDPRFPGGWKRTPGKRKRREPVTTSHAEPGPNSLGGKAGRPWGVEEWKKLEKEYKAERAAWVEKRDVRPLPAKSTSYLSWMTSGKTPEVESWDPERVLDRFLQVEGVEGSLGGEWERAVIRLRVDALERRAAVSKNTEATSAERSPKKLKTRSVSDIAGAIAPRTIRKMLSFVLPAFSAPLPVSRNGPSNETRHDGIQEKRVNNDLLGGLREAQAAEPDMRQIGNQNTLSEAPKPAPAQLHVPTSSTTLPDSHLPSVPTAVPASLPSLPAVVAPRPSLLTQSRPEALKTIQCHDTPSNPTTTSTATPPLVPSPSIALSSLFSTQPTGITAPLYPPLYPSLTQRSSAIARLFPDDSPFNAPPIGQSITPAPIAIPFRKTSKDSPSVKDLVRSFEGSGLLKGSLEKEKGILRRSQSSAGLRDIH